MRPISARLFVGIIVAAGAAFSMAQEARETQGPLHDPTRPPQLGATNAADPGAVTPAAGRIQMLLIGESRKYAVIDGVLLKPQDLHNQWRLSAINSESVVMQSASGTQVIKTNPLVVKTMRPQVGALSLSDGTHSNEKKPTRRSP